MYTCFLHPAPFQGHRSLSDTCPECGRPFDFPLTAAPKEVGDFTVLRSLGRGFYGATYLVESGALGHRDVLKVVPVAAYELFGKDFVSESRQHKEVADGTEHLASIRDIFGLDEGLPVPFGDVTVNCHVQVLDYVEGRPLLEYLKGDLELSGRAVAQIAIDLLRLLQELDARKIRHNDLHAGNILVQQLPQNARRADAVDSEIRAVAIDFGSLADTSASDPESARLGDVQNIARHLHAMSVLLLKDPDSANDDDYRLASALEQLTQQMTPDRVKQRDLGFEEHIDHIRSVVFFTDSPWRDPGDLKRFGEAYNAAALQSWYLPRLLVDPDGKWVDRIAEPGPQLITGMRGCGKTMLLRSLEIHARAAKAQLEVGPDGQVRDVLAKDNWIGLYESANRLLDQFGDETADGRVDLLHEANARLLVAYAREALQALRHLAHLDDRLVIPKYAEQIGRVVADQLIGADDLRGLASDVALERALQRKLAELAQRAPGLSMPVNAGLAFAALAEAVQASSPIWHGKPVLFLLDDVSTRNLPLRSIEPLVSRLLFKDETCAFKMTTEAQTVEQLRSPGRLETALIGRDIDVFDLGAEVNDQMRERGPRGGRAFLAQVLSARARMHKGHPAAEPEQILGTTTLESIARNIGEAATSRIRTTGEARRRLGTTYHGMTALSAVCVGDIGDVISIYETMLRKAGQSPPLPIPAHIQSAAYQEYSVRRLYHLNRRSDNLNALAVSFAKASHQLLVESYKRSEGKRLRQYASIHLKIDPASAEFKRVLEFIDAGVFVLQPGALGPRLKSTGRDPRADFILSFRKLFGLSSYIGLAERDRFELNGESVRAWLDDPGDPSVLMKGLGEIDDDYEAPRAFELSDKDAAESEGEGRLFDDEALFRGTSIDDEPRLPEEAEGDQQFLLTRVPTVHRISLRDLPAASRPSLVLGLGFEERTLESARRVLTHVAPNEVVLVRYREPGHGPQIEEIVREAGVPLRTVDYTGGPLDGRDLPSGPVVVDVTGLTKPLIFGAVRSALRRDREVFVVHTRADKHWPLNEDIERVLERHTELAPGALDGGSLDTYELIQAMSEISSGEQQPYRFIKLLPTVGDEARARVLCAAASPKHERLLSFVERREYDRLEVTVPTSESPRGQIARLAAEVARRGASESLVKRISSDNLPELLEFIGRRYRAWYHDGMDVEFALTGSKMHAAACAALASALKLSQAWYVKPDELDPQRFSVGVGETHVFRIDGARIVAQDPIDEWLGVAKPPRQK